MEKKMVNPSNGIGFTREELLAAILFAKEVAGLADVEWDAANRLVERLTLVLKVRDEEEIYKAYLENM